MISIIICSKRPAITDELKNNIRDSIGVPYELIVLDNSANAFSILSAYNKGIELSQYPNLCFVHEDISFLTVDWGKLVCRHLEDPSCGLIGLSGSPYQPGIPASWSLYGKTTYLLQSDKGHKKPKLMASSGYDKNHEKQVIGLDGMFLCARKALFEQIRFDEVTFKGFHAYDLDISMQAYVKGFRNKAINDILLVHYSKGHHDEKWVASILLFCAKWHEQLPASLIAIPDKEIRQVEYQYMTRVFLKNLIRSGYSNETCKQIFKTYMGHNEVLAVELSRFGFWSKMTWMRLKKKPITLIFPRKTTTF
ncbi:MAG: glycosyltransferase [Bacteroidota bacterium]|nr:glycosyltransferase [Bacteroidota bacterium]